MQIWLSNHVLNMRYSYHLLDMSQTAINKIMRIHNAEIAEKENPHSHQRVGYDPLHTDHKDHIEHKMVAHGHPHGAPANAAAATNVPK